MPRVLPVTSAVLPERSIFTRSRGRGVRRRRRRCRSSAPSAAGAIFFTSPLSTAPGPISTKSASGCSSAMRLDRARPLHGRRELFHEQTACKCRVVHGLRVHVRVDWEARDRRSAPGRAPPESPSTAYSMSGEWKAPLTFSRFALPPASFASSMARSTPADLAADHDLPGAVVVRRDDDARVVGRLLADLLDRRDERRRGRRPSRRAAACPPRTSAHRVGARGEPPRRRAAHPPRDTP